ncbi:MAG: hypothetical protein JRJ24_16180, partial [Deltaproteobacteria bacterium]|nr:hypothetical protein [Deltaproteobacteria bacterium]
MTSNKPTEWGGGSEAELAPVMRLIDFALVYAALWLPTYARGKAWDENSWAAATIAAVVFVVIAQSLRLYESPRGAGLKPQLVRLWAGWFIGVVPVLLFLVFISKRSEEYSRVVISSWFVLAPFFISVWRTAATLGLRELRTHGYNTRGAAIIGMTALG